MSVQGILNKGLNKETPEWFYKINNVCSAAAIYKRKLRKADQNDETLRSIFDKSENFPKLALGEEIAALKVAKGGDMRSISLSGT